MHLGTGRKLCCGRWQRDKEGTGLGADLIFGLAADIGSGRDHAGETALCLSRLKRDVFRADNHFGGTGLHGVGAAGPATDRHALTGKRNADIVAFYAFDAAIDNVGFPDEIGHE